jgi:hypothetical protein
MIDKLEQRGETPEDSTVVAHALRCLAALGVQITERGVRWAEGRGPD